ncbi:MAG: zinc metallopeptidase [Gammaproteobacteria bacterium]|nr:zinc metallopeptidase [Gammaproteobacteria bacterium]
MRWRGNQQSDNIEDRRGDAAPGRLGGGGGGIIRLLPVIYRFLGFKGTVIAALGIGAYLMFTGNLGILTGTGGLGNPAGSQQNGVVVESAEEQELVDFVSVVLADTEQTWHTLFQQQGSTYQEPRLVLFRNAVKSACGLGQAAMGPFYCPGDHKVYIDLSFYSDLKNRYKAPGDFAQAYVIAHEIGHHVQTLLGISEKVHQRRRGLSEAEGNKLSVRQELQADCLAGVWAFHAHQSRQMLEEGDVEEGLAAASAIGDDRLQKQGQGYVSPDSFTHGSSAQRVKWFKIGLAGGEVNACDTFSAAAL